MLELFLTVRFIPIQFLPSCPDDRGTKWQKVDITYKIDVTGWSHLQPRTYLQVQCDHVPTYKSSVTRLDDFWIFDCYAKVAQIFGDFVVFFY